MVINFYRGDNHQEKFRFKNFEGTLDNIFFTVKCALKKPRILKSLGKGIAFNDGWYYITFLPEDTNDLHCDLLMKYDIEIIVNGEKYTILKGDFVLEEDITTPDCEV